MTRRRLITALLIPTIGLSFIGAAALTPRTAPLITWNPTPSVPKGLYRRAFVDVPDAAFVRVDALAIASPYLRKRGLPADYSGRGALLKPIAALPGDEVCAAGAQIVINGEPRARRLATDSAGRALPAWDGCRRLSEGEAFLLAAPADSFDSRYFGPVAFDNLTPMRPVWTW